MKMEDKTAEFQRVVNRSGVRYAAEGGENPCEDPLVHEHFLIIEVNGMPAAEISCTADHFAELVLGRLCTSGVIRGTEDVDRIFICAKGERAEVILKEGVELRSDEGREPTCCSGNRQILAGNRKLQSLSKVALDRDAVFALAERFQKDTKVHRATSGTHSAYLRSPDGEIAEFEDISRHNALDKAVGYMLMQGYDPEVCMLYTTGRVPADMVEKVIMAGIPVLLSKSVPTDAALELAREYGLTLLCRTWPDSYVIYQ